MSKLVLIGIWLSNNYEKKKVKEDEYDYVKSRTTTENP